MDTTRFENIRPYRDEEISAAMHRIADSDIFPALSRYVYPESDVEEVKRYIRSISTIRQFQLEVMYNVNLQVIKRSIDNLSYEGVEKLDKDKRYLFVSNHRDIMLDSCLLQYILHINGHETTEITFGSNLMSHPAVIDIGKSNKMFRVERGGTMKEFYRSSMLLSEYIRHTVLDKRQSVWIAQRNGRTKDGMDRTEPGLIRMFAASCPEDRVKALDDLNIVPVSISYEWETCDFSKAYELYVSRTEIYTKRPGEDLESVLDGILSPKGNVHIAVCEPLSKDELVSAARLPKQDFYKAVAASIDARIGGSYKLHANNYIASDLISGNELNSRFYSETQKREFIEHLSGLGSYRVDRPDILRTIFLKIYANPLISHPNVHAGDNG